MIIKVTLSLTGYDVYSFTIDGDEQRATFQKAKAVDAQLEPSLKAGRPFFSYTIEEEGQDRVAMARRSFSEVLIEPSFVVGTAQFDAGAHLIYAGPNTGKTSFLVHSGLMEVAPVITYVEPFSPQVTEIADNLHHPIIIGQEADLVEMIGYSLISTEGLVIFDSLTAILFQSAGPLAKGGLSRAGQIFMTNYSMLLSRLGRSSLIVLNPLEPEDEQVITSVNRPILAVAESVIVPDISHNSFRYNNRRYTQREWKTAPWPNQDSDKVATLSSMSNSNRAIPALDARFTTGSRGTDVGVDTAMIPPGDSAFDRTVASSATIEKAARAKAAKEEQARKRRIY